MTISFHLAMPSATSAARLSTGLRYHLIDCSERPSAQATSVRSVGQKFFDRICEASTEYRNSVKSLPAFRVRGLGRYGHEAEVQDRAILRNGNVDRIPGHLLGQRIAEWGARTDHSLAGQDIRHRVDVRLATLGFCLAKAFR